jgi:hypothetical protein
MKTVKCMSFIALVGFFTLVVSSCDTNSDIRPQEDILPNSFSVDIPSSISNKNMASGGRIGGKIGGRVAADSIQGNDVYMNLGTFISVGEEASKLVEAIIIAIKKYRIDRVMSLTYVSDDDNRTKHLVVESDVEYESQTWDYQLTITDSKSQGASDGGKALQVFWNKKQTVKGIAIIKPYHCDRIKNAKAPDAVFRIDYSEERNQGYEAQMEVRIAGLPVNNPSEPYTIGSLRMFAGKNGDVVDVYGNSNHPNAVLFSGNIGLDWAFVATGSESSDLGVAEVGLPPSTLNSTDRNVLLKEYSIKNVFTSEILLAYPGLAPSAVANYLKNTAAPGYFNDAGFISGGVSPGKAWDKLASRLEALAPYNPKDISELTIGFK